MWGILAIVLNIVGLVAVIFFSSSYCESKSLAEKRKVLVWAFVLALFFGFIGNYKELIKELIEWSQYVSIDGTFFARCLGKCLGTYTGYMLCNSVCIWLFVLIAGLKYVKACLANAKSGHTQLKQEKLKLKALALQEINNGTQKSGLWALAIEKAMGDEQKSKALYIKYRSKKTDSQ